MTPGPHLDDGQLSALIDDEAAPGDLEHATTCAECAARVVAWQQTRRLVAATPEAPPAAQRDAAIAAALAEAGRPAAPVVPPAASPEVSPRVSAETSPVVSLSDRRVRRARRARAALAVAAVLLIVGVVTASVRSGRPGAHTSAKSSSAAPASSARQPSAPAARATTPAPQPVAHLGAVDGPAPLVTELRSELARPTSSSPSTPAGGAASSDAAVTACLDSATTDAHLPKGSDPSLEASLTYQGTPAGTFVFNSGPHDVAVVLAQAGCRLLADVTF